MKTSGIIPPSSEEAGFGQEWLLDPIKMTRLLASDRNMHRRPVAHQLHAMLSLRRRVLYGNGGLMMYRRLRRIWFSSREHLSLKARRILMPYFSDQDWQRMATAAANRRVATMRRLYQFGSAETLANPMASDQEKLDFLRFLVTDVVFAVRYSGVSEDDLGLEELDPRLRELLEQAIKRWR